MASPGPAQTSLALVFLALAAVRELSWWVRPAAPTAAPAEEAEPLLLEPSATWAATASRLWSSFQLGVGCALFGLVGGVFVGLWLRDRLFGSRVEVRIANQTSVTAQGPTSQHASTQHRRSIPGSRRGGRGVLEGPRTGPAAAPVVRG